MHFFFDKLKMVSATNCSHLIRQCETLKPKIQGKSQEVLSILSEESLQRQKLANLYKKILLNDLPYSLEKKVELELWNNGFKSHIDNFRLKMKEKRQEKYETQAKLSLFLDASTGFYFQLLQEFCSTYEMDLPFYGKNLQLGILKKANKAGASKKGKLNACLYICQDCLVHLGDLARYRNDLKQAELFYVLASKVLPGNGQPYNQLAILASAKTNQALAVFNYFKSISVPNSFPAASSNLHKTLSQLLCTNNSQSQFGSTSSLTDDQFISLYLQLMACLFLQDLDRASNLKDRITLEFKDVLSNLKKQQILTLASINLFNLTKYKPNPQHLTEEERAIWVQDLTVFLLTLQSLIEFTIAMLKSNAFSLKEQYKCLPAIKVLLDWMFCNHSDVLFEMEQFQENPLFFHEIATLGSLLVERMWGKDTDKSVMPLEEDWNMYGVAFLRKIHKRYDFKIQPLQMSDEELCQVRIHRIVSFLDWLTIFKSTSRYMSKSEENSLYACSLPLLPEQQQIDTSDLIKCLDDQANIPIPGRIKSWDDQVNISIPGRIKSWDDETSDSAGSVGDGSTSSFTEKTRSLFRTDSEDNNNPLSSNIQTTMAPYSLFNSMWSSNLQTFPQSEVGPNQVASNVLPLNRMNTTNTLSTSSGNPSNIRTVLPSHSLHHQPYLEGGIHGLNSLASSNTNHNMLQKENLQNAPIYHHFNNPIGMRHPSAMHVMNAGGNSAPVRNSSPLQPIESVLPNDVVTLRASPLLGGFNEQQQQSFGIIGQNVRVPNASTYQVQRPSLSDINSGMRQDFNQLRTESALPVSHENRSIWSCNFAIGQGELSPLEQLLQEQRRHQRMK